MRTITIFQPWASLVVHGFKRYETRGWQTAYRGPLLIHSAKRKRTADESKYVEFKRAMQFLSTMHGYSILPKGYIIGIVTLSDCVPVKYFDYHYYNVDFPRGVAHNKNIDFEKMMGDYPPDGYAWHLTNPTVFENPIETKGYQKLWECVLVPEILEQIPDCYKATFKSFI